MKISKNYNSNFQRLSSIFYATMFFLLWFRFVIQIGQFQSRKFPMQSAYDDITLELDSRPFYY